MDYRQIFKNLREDNDLTQQQIADICNVSDATVGHWENEKREMRIDCIVKLCKFYQISADYVLGLSNCKNINQCKEMKK